MRVLLISHDAVLARAYQARLQRAGYEVAVEATGHDGLARARRWTPDLILLDILLPGLHGLDVLKLLRDLPQLVRVPVVALIEHTLAQDVIDQCRLWGAGSMLHKDRCSVDDLTDHVHEVAHQASSRAAAPAAELSAGERVVS